jgi:hypothetical protein
MAELTVSGSAVGLGCWLVVATVQARVIETVNFLSF